MQTFDNKPPINPYTPEYTKQLQAQDAQRRAADPENIWKKQYSDYMAKNQGGMPDQPGYSGFTGYDGKLDPRFKVTAQPDVAFNSNMGDLNARLDGNVLDRTGLNAMRDRALTTGPSTWAQLMLDNQGLEQATATDDLARQNNAGRAGAYSSLATRGGASAGSRERIASKSMLGGLMGRQALARSGEQARTNINIQDEGQKLDLLKALPGAELGAAGFDLSKTNTWANMAGNENAMSQALALANRNYKTDVQKENVNTLKQDQTGRNSYNQDKWKVDADAWKALMQAGASEWG